MKGIVKDSGLNPIKGTLISLFIALLLSLLTIVIL